MAVFPTTPLWLLFALTLAAGAQEPAPPAAARAALRARLEAREATRVLFLGDSVTQGMHLPEPEADGFPAQFVRMLSQRYDAPVTAINLGVPGQATSGVLGQLDALLEAHRPHLVVLQFGGNDKGTSDGVDRLPTYRRNLAALIEGCHAAGVPCLVVAPPMNEPVTGMPYPLAAVEVARGLGVPVADADVALKAEGVDYRGVFAYFIHPLEFGHARIAEALDAAFLELIDAPRSLAMDVREGVLAPSDGHATLEVAVTNTAAAAQTVRLAVGEIAAPPEALPAGETRMLKLDLPLPAPSPDGRTQEWPLFVEVAGDDGTRRFAARRAVLAPRARCGATPASLGDAHRLLGRGAYDPFDLSATVTTACDQEALTVTINVVDDQVNGYPGPPFGDGVELFLDLRESPGAPWFTRRVMALFVSPSGGLTHLEADDIPDAILALEPQTETTPQGYRVRLSFPRAVLDAIAGRRVEALGLDIAVDDADLGQRDTQLVWHGRADNFVNPRALGVLSLDPAAPGEDTVVRVY